MFPTTNVSVWATPQRQSLTGRSLAGLMLLLWLGLCVTAGSPELHRLLHQDSQNAGHQCVLTQLQHNQIFHGVDALSVPTPVFVPVSCSPLASADFVPAQDRRLAPSRAPPSMLSSVAVAG